MASSNDTGAPSRVCSLVNNVQEDGYVIIPNAFSKEEIAQAKAEVERLSRIPGAGPASEGGRNPFEGYQTRRIYALLNKSRVFDKFTVHPDVMALNDHFLDEGFLINAFMSINILPGEDPQALHHDDSPVKLARPRPPLTAAIMVALDDYTADNGSTVVVPKSHQWADRKPFIEEAKPVIMRAGSIVYFVGTLWHGGGHNETQVPRLALTVQYCMSWMRPLENQQLAVDWDKLDDIPPRIIDMMGYKVGQPFIGYVDGRSPRTRVTQLTDKSNLRVKL